jgi:DNA polymerase III subunit delta
MQNSQEIFDKIMTDLHQRKFFPIYFLMGEEPYFIDKISDYILKNVLKEEEKAFNQTILYGKDVDAAAITNAAKRYPMMSEYQVVVIREAQYIKDIDKMIYYVSSPLKSTILVLNYKYKKLDKRTKLFKELESHGVVFETKKLYDDKIPAWVNQHLTQKGYQIQPAAAILLTEFLGNDLQKIEKELEKLVIVLPEGNRKIDIRHIEENIGISKDFNNIELQKALVNKDSLKAFRIIDYFGHNQKNNPITVTITSLYFFYNKVFLYSMLEDKSKESVVSKLKINAFFVPDYQKAAKAYPPAKTFRIISWLREYDLRSKGVENVSSDPHDLLKELIYKILVV